MFFASSRIVVFLLGSFFGSLALSAGERLEFTLLDGETVRGELVGIYSGIVFIDSGRGKSTRVPYKKLDAASRLPVDAWLKSYLNEKSKDAPKVRESDSRLTSYLKHNLRVWRDGELVDYDFSSKSEPEFYAFYYSAHWCGPCRRFTPKLRAFYNAMKKLGHDNFEIIFVSSDTSNRMMEQYMKEDKMPWPAVEYSRRTNRVVSEYAGPGIPCLVVTDRYGKLLAHSYAGSEYIGPENAKDYLESLLKYTATVDRKLSETKGNG